MSKLLSLDLGLTTGYSVISHNGVLNAHGEFPYAMLAESVVSLLSSHKPRWVLAETPVIIRGPLGDQLTTVVSSVRTLAPHVVEIQATEWKGSWWGTDPLLSKLLKGLSRHEKDAILMGWWYLDTRLKTTDIRTNILDVDFNAYDPS